MAGFLDALGGLGGAVSAGSGILSGISGLIQSGQARKRLKSLVDPGYKIPKEFSKNLLESENLAKTGIPTEQYNQASTNIQRGTQAGLRQLSRMSNPFAGIAGLQRGQQDAFAKLDAQNAAARRQNILGAMGARRELAGQKLAQQQYAQQKYMDEVNQANALLGAGKQNVAGALGSLGQMGLYQSLYGEKNTPNINSTIPMSPTALSTISSYETPSLKNMGSPTDIYGLNTQGNMNLGSLNNKSRFSGFGFSNK